jgi:hypothetical protein
MRTGIKITMESILSSFKSEIETPISICQACNVERWDLNLDTPVKTMDGLLSIKLEFQEVKCHADLSKLIEKVAYRLREIYELSIQQCLRQDSVSFQQEARLYKSPLWLLVDTLLFEDNSKTSVGKEMRFSC